MYSSSRGLRSKRSDPSGTPNCHESPPTAQPLQSRGSSRYYYYHRPATCAYLIYDLASPVFSTSEIDAIFSPSPSPPLSATGWGAFLNSRIEHITGRSPSLGPSAICIGEYSSASVAHPCAVHGVGQIFRGWDTHPAAKKFKQMIAGTPVIEPTGNGPAQILKGFLDEFSASRDPLDLTWVLKFLLVPKVENVQWGLRDWQELCMPDNLREGQFRQVALLCVRQAGMDMEEVGRRLMEFGKLFSVEVIIVSSLGR